MIMINLNLGNKLNKLDELFVVIGNGSDCSVEFGSNDLF